MDTFSSELYEQAVKRVIKDSYEPKILSNLVRPLLIERLIELLLGNNWRHTGANWAGWDIEHIKEDYRIEVKQSAARQTWSNRESLGGKLTKGTFDIRARTGYFDKSGSIWTSENGRHADAYIFAWHGVGEENETDHRDVKQWQFYLLPTSQLPMTKTLSLLKLQKLCEPISYNKLAEAVELMRLKKISAPPP